jgi:hypothetical protein
MFYYKRFREILQVIFQFYAKFDCCEHSAPDPHAGFGAFGFAGVKRNFITHFLFWKGSRGYSYFRTENAPHSKMKGVQLFR